MKKNTYRFIYVTRKLDGTKISAGVTYKKLELIEKRKGYLWERRYS